MEACRVITITNEDIDFTVQGAEPTYIVHNIIAEYPATQIERSRGMQHRVKPSPRTAMLFEFDGDHNPAMWMKDTPASLDMIFISATGAAFYVEAGTTPLSEQFLTPEEPDPIARYVLELPAGGVDRLGISPGSSTFTFKDPKPCKSFIRTA